MSGNLIRKVNALKFIFGYHFSALLDCKWIRKIREQWRREGFKMPNTDTISVKYLLRMYRRGKYLNNGNEVIRKALCATSWCEMMQRKEILQCCVNKCPEIVLIDEVDVNNINYWFN